MGIAAYNRGSSAIARSIQADLPKPERIIFEKSPQQPKYEPLTKHHVRRVMKQVVGGFDPVDDGPTQLAEYAADLCDCKQIGGPLDDETHWIWDLAVDVWEWKWGRI
jgi:hypothetical protein